MYRAAIKFQGLWESPEAQGTFVILWDESLGNKYSHYYFFHRPSGGCSAKQWLAQCSSAVGKTNSMSGRRKCKHGKTPSWCREVQRYFALLRENALKENPTTRHASKNYKGARKAGEGGSSGR